MKKKNTWAALPVLAAGTLWGLMGLFVRRLNAAGLGAMEVAELRILTGLALVGLYLLVARRDLLRVRLRDLWCFFGTGVISLLLFSNCYFTAMRYASLSAAAVLLYTAPAFVMVLSLLLFGLGAGFFYALYSIFGRYAIRRGYQAWTLTFYTFLFCALGGAALTDWGAVGAALSASGPGTAGWILTMGVVTAVLPYVLYAVGLEHMESSRASILASVEPVVGTLVGVLLFHEPLTAGGVAGTALVLSAVALLSLPARAKTS